MEKEKKIVVEEGKWNFSHNFFFFCYFVSCIPLGSKAEEKVLSCF